MNKKQKIGEIVIDGDYVTYFGVYEQQWFERHLQDVPSRELAAMPAVERDAIIAAREEWERNYEEE